MKNETTIHLENDRLVLRQFVGADYPKLLDLDTDPEVMRFLSDGKPKAAEDVRAFLDGCIDSYPKLPGFGFWAAIEKPSNEFIGWFHFRPDREFAEEVEVGYRLSRSAWGRGLATEGAKALIKNGFENQNVRSVTGRTMKANGASLNVLQKCGLVLVREYEEDRFPGIEKTGLFLRLTRGEWIRSRSSESDYQAYCSGEVL